MGERGEKGPSYFERIKGAFKSSDVRRGAEKLASNKRDTQTSPVVNLEPVVNEDEIETAESPVVDPKEAGKRATEELPRVPASKLDTQEWIIQVLKDSNLDPDVLERTLNVFDSKEYDESNESEV